MDHLCSLSRGFSIFFERVMGSWIICVVCPGDSAYFFSGFQYSISNIGILEQLNVAEDLETCFSSLLRSFKYCMPNEVATYILLELSPNKVATGYL